MTFYTWWNQDKIKSQHAMTDARAGWNAAKSEILKILKKNTVISYGESFVDQYIDVDALKEIKKL